MISCNNLRFKYVRKGNMIEIFPESIPHHIYGNKKDIQSAGFVNISSQDGKILIECYGESTSIGVASKGEEDASLIRALHYFGD